MAKPRHTRNTTTVRVIGRVVLLPLVALGLVAGIAGGLLRAGVILPGAASASWLGQAVVAHAFLMVCAFMGTVIGIERAVAVKAWLAFSAPVLSGLGGLAALLGAQQVGAVLAVLASLAFVGVNVVVVARQRAAHTALLLVGAVAWLLGNLAFAIAASRHAVVPWWFAFLVLTIAAERLEMTRLMRKRPAASQTLYVILGAMLAGCALFSASPQWGGLLYGASLTALAAWLLTFDVARRTIASTGLSRYMAVCLLLGYLWLGVAGVSWCATSLGLPLMDAAIHALALGFVFSMMLGHAPVILPAVARVKLLYGWWFYLPLAALHISLAVRLLLRHTPYASVPAGAAGNAAAIALFAATVVASALAWRLTHSTSVRQTRDATSADS